MTQSLLVNQVHHDPSLGITFLFLELNTGVTSNESSRKINDHYISKFHHKIPNQRSQHLNGLIHITNLQWMEHVSINRILTAIS